MGIFNEFNKKEKPVFTGLKFGFGSGGGDGGPSLLQHLVEQKPVLLMDIFIMSLPHPLPFQQGIS